MELQPETRKIFPGYPAAENFDRRLLEAPPGPGRRLALGAAAVTLATLLSGCGEAVCQTEGEPPAPAYISEADVLAVIRDEADRLGIPLTEDGAPADLGEAGSLAVDLSGTEGTVGFSYVDYPAGESLPYGGQALESALPGLSAWETAEGLNLCVLDGIDQHTESFDEEALREAFRDFVDWLRESGKL